MAVDGEGRCGAAYLPFPPTPTRAGRLLGGGYERYRLLALSST